MMRRSLALLVLCLAFACGRDESVQPPQGPAAPPFPDRPPIIVISIDTLRSDRLPAYGYAAGETPAIDALRRDAILYERAYSHTPLTLPSHASILTGLLPGDHGVRDNQGYELNSASATYLPRELKQLGYATGAAVSAYVLRGEAGLAAGFDVYEDDIDLRGGVALGGVARPGTASLEVIEPWLRKVAAEPFFLLFHLFEPHMPYEPPDPSRWADPYDGEVAAADAVVGRLLALLRELDAYERSAIVLLSDHGEGLGDHGELEHGIFLYREALQVPLLLKLPESHRRGDTVAAPVQLIDVLPTLLGIAGTEPPAGLPGASLLETPAGARRIHAETFYPRIHYGWSDLASVVEGDLHFIDGPDPELFDLADDPGETRNTLRENRRLAADLRTHLEGRRRPLEPPTAVDAETREKLAALGYLGGTAASPSGPLADPKAQLPTLEDLRRAAEHLARGEPEAAVPLYRRALTANPGMLDGWQTLGDVLLRLGRPDEAVGAYLRSFELSGGDPDLGRRAAAAYEQLGLQHLRRRAWEAAREASRGAVDLDPERADAWNNLGVALYYLGERPAALDAWQRAVELDPRNLDTLYNLGTRAAELGHHDRARRALESFVEQAPPERYRTELRQARILLQRLGD